MVRSLMLIVIHTDAWLFLPPFVSPAIWCEPGVVTYAIMRVCSKDRPVGLLSATAGGEESVSRAVASLSRGFRAGCGISSPEI